MIFEALSRARPDLGGMGALIDEDLLLGQPQHVFVDQCALEAGPTSRSRPSGWARLGSCRGIGPVAAGFASEDQDHPRWGAGAGRTGSATEPAAEPELPHIARLGREIAYTILAHRFMGSCGAGRSTTCRYLVSRRVVTRARASALGGRWWVRLRTTTGALGWGVSGSAAWILRSARCGWCGARCGSCGVGREPMWVVLRGEAERRAADPGEPVGARWTWTWR